MHVQSTAIAVALMVALTAGPALADTPSPVSQTQNIATFDIPAQPLASALKQYADQSGLQLAFETALAAGHISPQVKGQLTNEAALKRLLEGTGLRYDFLDNRTVAVAPALKTGATNDAAFASGSMQLAQNTSERRSAQQTPVSRGEDESAKGVPEILVQGSKILNMDIARSREDTQPYVILDRETIRQSGATTVEDLLKKRLTMNTVAKTNTATRGATVGATSNINLHGLGSNQTLILIDGHRLSSISLVGTLAQPDLNSIPMSAIERIEVLPTTASAIYGGSATGGVVNVIMRRDYNGAEVTLGYDNSFSSDTGIRRADFSGGFATQDGSSSVLLSASYSDSGQLWVQDRDFYTRGVNKILSNNPSMVLSASSSPVAVVPNVRSATGANLVLKNNTALGSPFTYVPFGYTGTGDGGAALAANAGRYNVDPPQSVALVGGPKTRMASATLRHQFTPRLQAFLDVSAAENEGHSVMSLMSVLVPLSSTVTSNPFQQNIQVVLPYGLVGDMQSTNASRRAVGGVIVQLPADWRAALDYTWSTAKLSFQQGDQVLSAAGAAALSNGTIDILRDTTRYPIDFSPYLQPGSDFYSPIPFRSRLGDATVRLSGGLGRLPAGRPQLSVMLETREEILKEASLISTGLLLTYPEREQTVHSVSAEMTLPVISARNALPAVAEFEVQLAARYDDYTTTGATTLIGNTTTPPLTAENTVRSSNPTAGIRYRINDSVMLRGSYSGGFLPPATNLLVLQPQTSAMNLIDPRRGGNPVTVPVGQSYFGGNPDLKPEKSKSWSAGVVLTPSFVPDLRLSLDYLRIRKTDNILANPGPQQILNNEAFFPGRVVRNAPTAGDPYGVGTIAGIDFSALNTSSAQVEAIDMALDYRRAIGSWGTLAGYLNATRQNHLLTRLLPTLPEVEFAGVSQGAGSNIPVKFKAVGGLSWSFHRATLGWNFTYLDSYWAADPTVPTNAGILLAQGNGGRVPSQAYHDVFASYQTASGGGSGWVSTLLENTEFRAGVRNLFNTSPPFDAGAGALGSYYSPLGDPRLASYYLSLRRAF